MRFYRFIVDVLNIFVYIHAIIFLLLLIRAIILLIFPFTEVNSNFRILFGISLESFPEFFPIIRLLHEYNMNIAPFFIDYGLVPINSLIQFQFETVNLVLSFTCERKKVIIGHIDLCIIDFRLFNCN